MSSGDPTATVCRYRKGRLRISLGKENLRNLCEVFWQHKAVRVESWAGDANRLNTCNQGAPRSRLHLSIRIVGWSGRQKGQAHVGQTNAMHSCACPSCACPKPAWTLGTLGDYRVPAPNRSVASLAAPSGNYGLASNKKPFFMGRT